ncbi:MAG: sigma 54-dependent Fis family transcriptional regulator [Myxococcota bacterium]
MSVTLSPSPLSAWLTPGEPPLVPTLTVLWCRAEPERMGELFQLPLGPSFLGRGAGSPEHPHLMPLRQRPGLLEPRSPLASPRLSRQQLKLEGQGSSIRVENLGRCVLSVNGQPTLHATLKAGELLEIQDELLLLFQMRPALLVPRPEGAVVHAFGEPDAFGIIGESPQVWGLRNTLFRLATLPDHLLVTGPSGAGKELIARALHQLSPRALRPPVARNAATLPESLIEAELFGNVKGYPTPTMQARPGLVGEADGSTLILDEIGELPIALQARLLRLMDAGEYHRLGEAKPSRASLRILAMTNRPEALKHDVAARFSSRVMVPGLSERPEDIPLIARHLASRRWQALRRGEPGTPTLTPRLISAFIQHRWSTHVRELDAMLLTAVLESPSRYLDVTAGVQRLLSAEPRADEHRADEHRPETHRAGQASKRFLARENLAESVSAPEDESALRLRLLRAHAFSPAACGEDPGYPGNRQTADLHWRLLMVDALERHWPHEAGAEAGAEALHDALHDARRNACIWLAGQAEGPGWERVVERMVSFTQSLAQRAEQALVQQDVSTFEQAIKREYKRQGERVSRLAVRLARVQG